MVVSDKVASKGVNMQEVAKDYKYHIAIMKASGQVVLSWAEFVKAWSYAK